MNRHKLLNTISSLDTRIKESIALLLLIIITLIITFNRINFNIHPFEDAAILMRYAENFANGHGIVWNIGERPIDGATDFLFMIFVSALIKTGLTVETATRLIGSISHFLTIIIIYFTLRKLYNANRIISFTLSLYFAIGSGMYFVVAYFGTPLFALSATITWGHSINNNRKGKFE